MLLGRAVLHSAHVSSEGAIEVARLEIQLSNAVVASLASEKKETENIFKSNQVGNER